MLLFIDRPHAAAASSVRLSETPAIELPAILADRAATSANRSSLAIGRKMKDLSDVYSMAVLRHFPVCRLATCVPLHI